MAGFTVVRRPRTLARAVTVVVALLFPVLLFLLAVKYSELDPAFGDGSSHFYVVTAVSAFAMALACAVLWAARTSPAARTLFLALGFLAMAVIFLAHGLGTSPFFPGPHAHRADDQQGAAAPVTAESSLYGGLYGSPAGGSSADTAGAVTLNLDALARLQVVGYSAQLSLLVSSLLFALAALDLPERLSRTVVRFRWPFAGIFSAVLTAHLVTALWFPRHLSWLPMDHDGIAWALGASASLALAFAGWRFYQAYRLALLPIQAGLAVAMVMLIESQWFMLFGRLWHLSWWEYHMAMLAGFVTGVAGLLHHYRITGDLGAIVEGLFLRQQVTGIHAGDPRAMRALAAAVAAKDSETAGHIERVGDLSVGMGVQLWVPPERLTVLRWAGRLHDVGKIGVPDAILRKPASLTLAEYEVIKRHAPRGWEIAHRTALLREAAPIIRAHHERLDGSGYPDGLRGDEIPFEARIVAVADVWDALTSDRPYRVAMSTPEAAEVLLEEGGQHLDPACVEALFQVLGLPRYARLAAIDRGARAA